MGIDASVWTAILRSLQYISKKNNCLTIGRQRWDVDNIPVEKRVFCEEKLKELGFGKVDSMDYSDYEGCSIIHDLNRPITIDNKFDFVLDGGTIEHIFNIPQVFENVIDLLEVGGIYCCLTVNNNFSGHGMYQFSPELFHCAFTEKYGMEIKEMYLAIEGSTYGWIDVWNNKHNDGINRTTSGFNTTHPVYIIMIAKKISDKRDSLITSPPSQYGYTVEWNT